ncbi:MAG TPA: CHC2 zinc finger domain-containing protein [Isosphaeraceae bacterium]|jgi:DNA primase|nr:CHC2 zinc finger domain-containing protein [Isosphaeraceae bacterium]
MSERTDFAAVAAAADLPALMRAEGIEVRHGRAFCPFHENTRTPAMSIYHDGQRWRFKCHGCGAKGDAVSWRAMRDDSTPATAASKLDPGKGTGRSPRTARTARAASPTPAASAPLAGARPTSRAAWKHPQWQAACDGLVLRAESELWAPGGQRARDWLRARGLEDHTIRRFRLGFFPAECRSEPLDALADASGPRPIRAARGICFPWVRPGSWYASEPDRDDPAADPGPRWVGANVRRLMTNVAAPIPKGIGKCRAFDGSARGHAYPWTDVMPGVEALLVEGEPDALLAFQAVGHVVNPMTLGGASQAPAPEAAAALAACPAWLVATDHDGPGDDAARRLAALAPHKAHRVWLPEGKDLTDFVVAGGDAPAWLRGEFRRLGLPWPFREEACP